VRSSGRGEITVAHSRTVSRVQRRSYYRRKLAKPVYVRAAGSREKPLRSALLDLSGGGASLRRTGDIFREDGALELAFFISGDTRLDLRARVVRLTPETAHVSFDGVPDPVRDRIIGYLFTCREA
jgi:c-di-GMP-binding flagellar brake protein YcgR